MKLSQLDFSRFLLVWIGLVATFAVAGCSPSEDDASASAPITVSAAASLQDAMQAVQRLYQEREQTVSVVYNFGSSGSLQQQIEQGAPVDVFLSAAPQQMDALAEKGLLLEGSRRDLLQNTLVLIMNSRITKVSDFSDLQNGAIKRIALGDPESVPAGQYGKAVLTTLGLYDALVAKFVFAKDVRQVLSYVETGNAEAGLVYATDAKGSDQVTVVEKAPANAQPPIVYPVAVIGNSPNPAAAIAFIDFLYSDEVQAVFADYGFTPVDASD